MVRKLSVIAVLMLACLLANAQEKLEFEVASIKPAAPMQPGRFFMGQRGGPGTNDPGRVTYTNASLQMLLVQAYNVKPNQIQNAPKWFDTDHFDIAATIPPGTSKEQFRVMLQNFLIDRFKLQTHIEKKEMPMYALVVGKNGPKMKESAPEETLAASAGGPGDAGAPPPLPRPDRLKMGTDGCPDASSFPRRKGSMMLMMNGTFCMISANTTLADLADRLSSQFDRPVVDMTGLTANYDFTLRYDPSSTGGGMMRRGPMMMGPPPGGGAAGAAVAGPGPGSGPVSDAPGSGPAPDREPSPTIFAALQDQLGLKLDSRKGPVDLLVIDRIERTPTEN